MESYLKSQLNDSLSFKNEVKSILSIQVGSKYGFLIEIQSPMGIFYCPMIGIKSKDIALQTLRSELRKA